MTVSMTDIEALALMFEQSKWNELELHIGDADIFLSKDAKGIASWEARGSSHAPAAVAPAIQRSGALPQHVESVAALVEKPEMATASLPEGCVYICAPSLGMFYRSAKPGSDPFVEIGQRVDADTELCLIEVMKLFTTLRAGVSGVVKEMLCKDGDMVEFDQPIFIIDTKA